MTTRRVTPKRARLCLGAHMSVAGGVSKAVDAAMRLGLQSLQIFTKNASRWQQKPIDRAEVKRFQERRAAWGAHPVVSHDSYLINLASPEPGLWKKSIRALIDELERAELLGLDFLVMHPGAHVGSGVEAGIARVAEGIRRVFLKVPQRATRLLLENTAGQGTTLGRSFAELAALLEALQLPDRVGVCIDSCHLFAAGYDLSSKGGYAQTMKELDSRIRAEQVFALHLNDSKGKLGSHLDRHQHIGQGEIGKSGFR
ncbi:MAG: deoxyribonuclease IV, partial [Planctomycetota bacterium]